MHFEPNEAPEIKYRKLDNASIITKNKAYCRSNNKGQKLTEHEAITT
jgi:hypothetical protein